MENFSNKKYPPSNLFDNNLKTCWVSDFGKIKDSSIYIKIPKKNQFSIDIFSGYGKSKSLYFKNSRPKKIRVKIFVAINPSGYVTEIGSFYRAMKYPNENIIYLKDKFGTQSFNIQFSHKKIIDFQNMVLKDFDLKFKKKIDHSCLILKLEIIDIYKGSKYDDLCISEIIFKQ